MLCSIPVIQARCTWFVMIVLAVMTLPSHAQSRPVPAGPPLTTVQQVQALGARAAEEKPRLVALKGVVLFVGSKRDDFKVYDGERSIGVSVREKASCPKVGDLVEIEGHTDALNVQAYIYPHVFGEKIRVTGQSPLPAAPEASMGALVEFKHYDQWMTTEGIVLMWTHKGSKLSLMILGQETWGVVHILGVGEADRPENLLGARVRVTGVNMGFSHSEADTMNVPLPSLLKILKPGKADVFDAPDATASDVNARRLPLLERVKVKGVVTARVRENVLALREGDQSFTALILHGWLRSTGNGQTYGDAGRLPDLKPGDEVEVVGSIIDPVKDSRRAAYSLCWCHVRVTGHQNPPQPVLTSVTEILAGNHEHDLVQVRARLLHKEQVPVGNAQWRTTMTVESEGATLYVTHQSKTQDALGQLNTDDDLLLSAVVEKAMPNQPRLLWLPSPGHAASLGVATSVQERRLWVWGGSAACIVLLLGLWIVLLQRSMKRQAQADATVRELNASLEQRVVERTQELESTQLELRRALEHERELGELKSRFVTMVSHEFRTPLGIIMSAVELMRHYEERLPAEQRRELCDDIHSATRLMASLMEQVLVLGRVEAGKLGCRVAPLDLDVLAGKVTDELLSATNRRCPILWQPLGSLAGAVADEALLRHIFSNLITNAVKYSPEGENVIFAARREGQDAVFQVIDRGIGIPAEDQARLFEAFYRCSNVGEIPGTGLGLVIVKRCVELHNGVLTLDSQPGRGTTFTVRLPLFPSA
jgi:signal transduction histidine kinase